jgi:hypothetical protein
MPTVLISWNTIQDLISVGLVDFARSSFDCLYLRNLRRIRLPHDGGEVRLQPVKFLGQRLNTVDVLQSA